ncbi:MAG: glycosyltransferase family 39 protein [Anaerolineae bacterium]
MAFGLRLYAIDRQDIWGDEAFSIWLSAQPLSQVVAGGADTHPPLYPLLLHLWLRLAGSSPLAVRFLSACIGTLAAPVVFVLGHRVLGRTTGLLAALLTAVSPVLVYYSQETRMYGLVTLLTAASVYWVVRVLDADRDAISPYVFYGLVTLAAAYSHYYAFFVVLAQNMVALPVLLHRRRWLALRRWLTAQGLIALAYVPWIAVQSRFLSGRASARFDEWNLSSALRMVWETIRSFGAGLAVPSVAAASITIMFLIALFAGLAALLRRRESQPWLIVTYLVAPFLLAWAVNPFMPFFHARYLLLIAPAFYLLAAWGVVTSGRLWLPLAAMGSVFLLTGSAYGLHGYYTDDAFIKGRYGQMMAFIELHAQPDDGLILANQLQRPIYEYYRPEELEGYFFPRYGYPLEDPRTARDLESIAARHPRLWLIRFGNPAVYDPDGYLIRWLATHGSKAYFGGWVDADLSLYVTMPAAKDESIQHPVHLDLGDRVRLLGYTLDAEHALPGGSAQLTAGDTLLLTLHWQALAPMEKRYTVFTHLLDADGQIRAQMDSEPQGGGLPTDRWAVGQIVQDNYALTVADDTPPGPHVLEVGMYLLETLERLSVRDPDTGESLGDRVLLGTIEVTAP